MTENTNINKKDTETHDFLSGGGGTGELIRSYNWSKTSLGPVGNWPISLRSALSICLGSAFPIAIYWGKDLTLLYNDAWSPIPGSKHPQVLGRPAKEVWPEIWDTIGPLFEQVFSSGKAIRSKDGLLLMNRHGYTEECYFDFTFTPVRGEKGDVEGVFNAVVETTYRVLNERRTGVLQKLGEKINRLRSEESLWRAAIETLSIDKEDIPFFLLYSLNDVKPCLQGFIGLTEEELPSSFPLSENELNKIIQSNRLIETWDPKKVINLKEWLKVLPKGIWPEPPTQAILLPLQLANGTISGFLVSGISPRRELDKEYQNFFHSIGNHLSTALTNIKAYEEERKRAEALAEIDKAKTIFFSNVSHELRTPLTLILGPLEEILNKKSGIDKEAKHQIDLVHRNSLRLLRLVNTLLDFSRIEAGRLKAAFIQTDICQYTADLSSLFRSAVEKAGIQFNIFFKEIKDPVFIDRTMWERIVFNLLSNALKFTFEGEISVSLKQEGKMIEMIVKDTGTGIPKEELPKLFSRFHRIENVKGRTHEGTGIGLAMVQELVKLHGGSVTVESNLGEGTSFTVYIPTGEEHLPKEQIINDSSGIRITLNAPPDIEGEIGSLIHDASQTLPLVKVEDRLTEDKILVVDDNSDMREYIAKLLGNKYIVVTANDGLDALKIVAKERLSLILSDIMMPNLDGLGLLKRLKSNKDTVELPIILISARAGEEATIEGIEAGADDYLVKPFSGRELLARVKANLEMYRLRKEVEREVKAERQRLLDLFIQAPAAIAVVEGRDHVYTLANPLYQRLFNRKEEDLLGKTIREVFPEIEGQGVYEIFDSVFETGETFVANEYEVIFNRNECGPHEKGYFKFVAHPIKNNNGSVTDILIHAYEITEQVIARQMIKESEEYFRMMTNNVPVMVWITNPDASCVYLNQQWYEYTGQSKEEALGMGWLKATHPDDTKQAAEVFLDANRKRLPFSLEYRLKRKDGQYRWAMDSGMPKFDEQGNFEGYLGVVIDIHQRKLAEQDLELLSKELAAANEELSASNEEISASNDELSVTNQKLIKVNSDLDNFIYTASHDLKAPIANLEGLLNALSKKRNLQNQDDKIIELMYQSIDRFKSTIKDLTEITHAQRESNEEKILIGFQEMLQEVKENIKDLMERYIPVIKTDFKVSEIHYSRKNLRSIFYNLLSNAIKYSSPERRPEVSISTRKEAGYILFEISDNGVGISEGSKEKIFQMFKRLHNHVEGTGIGLYIVKRMIENEDGRIEVESKPGKGTTFRVYFKD